MKILTTPRAFTLLPTIATMIGAQSITVDADSRCDIASGHTHGDFRRLTRDNAILAICHALLASDKGKQLVTLASQGDAQACALLATATPGVWKASMGNVAEHFLQFPNGLDATGNRASRPDPSALALRVLNAESNALAKAEKAAAKAQAKADKEAEKVKAREAKAQAPTVAPKSKAGTPAKVKKGKAQEGEAKAKKAKPTE